MTEHIPAVQSVTKHQEKETKDEQPKNIEILHGRNLNQLYNLHLVSQQERIFGSFQVE